MRTRLDPSTGADHIPELEKIEQAKQRAMGMLGRRAYSEHEIQQKLENDHFEAAVIRLSIDRLRALKYIDDAALARQMSERYLVQSRLGPQAILRRMTERGISESLARSSIEEILRGSDERNLALRFLKRRYPHVEQDSSIEEKGRAARGLLRSGFSSDTVRQLLAISEEDGMNCE
jgi:SOS response regulatory protein OraA/RecX